MVLEGKKDRFENLSFEEIEKALNGNEELRHAVIKMLARDHSKDFLARVNVNASLLNQMSARFVSSDKEWQE